MRGAYRSSGAGASAARPRLTVSRSALDAARLEGLLRAETERFTDQHPRSGELAAEARSELLDGVPMSWMSHWASPYPFHNMFLACPSTSAEDVDRLLRVFGEALGALLEG